MFTKGVRAKTCFDSYANGSLPPFVNGGSFVFSEDLTAITAVKEKIIQ